MVRAEAKPEWGSAGMWGVEGKAPGEGDKAAESYKRAGLSCSGREGFRKSRDTGVRKSRVPHIYTGTKERQETPTFGVTCAKPRISKPRLTTSPNSFNLCWERNSNQSIWNFLTALGRWPAWQTLSGPHKRMRCSILSLFLNPFCP